MMRLPRFEYRAPRRWQRPPSYLAAADGEAMLVAGGTDLLPNMKRRQQTPAVARRSARRRRTAPGRRTAMGSRSARASPSRDVVAIRACASLHRPVAGGRADRDAAPAQHGNTRRQSVPRHPLQLLRPDLRMAEGDRLLHEEGRRHVLGRAVEPRLSGGLVDRHGADARWRSARASRSERQRRRAYRVADLYRNDGIDYLTRRPDEILTAVHLPRRDRLAQHLLEAAAPRLVRLSGASAAGARKSPLTDGRGRASRARRRLVAAGEAATRGRARSRAHADGRDDRGGRGARRALAKPMDNTDFSLVWRKRMVREFVTYALREVRGDDVRELRRRVSRAALLSRVDVQ